MSEQAPATAKTDLPTEDTKTPTVVPPPAGDGELREAELNSVAGGFAPAPARKAGKGQHEYLIPW
jgi:hypothetical protein